MSDPADALASAVARHTLGLHFARVLHDLLGGSRALEFADKLVADAGSELAEVVSDAYLQGVNDGIAETDDIDLFDRSFARAASQGTKAVLLVERYCETLRQARRALMADAAASLRGFTEFAATTERGASELLDTFGPSDAWADALAITEVEEDRVASESLFYRDAYRRIAAEVASPRTAPSTP